MRRSLALLFAFISSCQCGGGLCDAVTCSTGFVCDTKTGVCKQDHSGQGGGGSGGNGGSSSGGGTASSSGGGTGGGAVLTCSDLACDGGMPFCDSSAGSAQCVQCRTGFDCIQGLTCDLGSHTCVFDTGTGGGTSSNGGGSGNTGPVIFDDGGMSAHCLQTSGPAQCTTECSRGYECVGGVCQLRGSTGPVQVTLRFNQPEDLDLHVEEPRPDGGQCDIYYGDANSAPDAGPITIGPITIPPDKSRCGAVGWLDLDSNAACNIDNVDVENVIYPNGGIAPSGRYLVRVDYYQDCSASGPVPYEVEIRANGQTEYYCGTFDPSDSNGGGENSGRTIAGFTIP